MKKLIAVLLLLFVLLIAGIYFFIPDIIVVNNVAPVHCSLPGAARTVIQKENWKKIGNGTAHFTAQKLFNSNDFFLYNTDTFRIVQLLQNALQIDISNRNMKVNSTLLLLPLTQDSIVLNWNYKVAASTNALIRLQQYQQAVHTKKNMTAVLTNIASFLNKNENIYGFPITQTSTNDTSLISTKSVLNAYPSTGQIYSSIEKLKTFAKDNGAAETGFPMMNVTQINKQFYMLMTALPTDKMLSANGDIAYKHMVPGRFLTMTVVGGNETVNYAYYQMQQYIQDYNRTSMAIPFLYLITDRSKETDTSKWVTKLYFPVM